MIDTHCHLHFPAFDEDRDEVIRRGFDAGLTMVTVGADEKSSRDAVQLAERHTGMFATVGVHPTDITADFKVETIRAVARHPKVVAIGECGLEYYRLPAEGADDIKRRQQDVFREHCALATELDLPLIVHCRDAHEDMRRILASEINVGRLARRGIIHSFTGSADDARAYVDLGFYIGVNGIVTFAKPRAGQEFLPDVVRTIPLERIVLETDAPYLAPDPFRGKRNEPAFILETAKFVAGLFGKSVAEIDHITTKNAKKLLNLAV